jgi:hypothetical protein
LPPLFNKFAFKKYIGIDKERANFSPLFSLFHYRLHAKEGVARKRKVIEMKICS